MCLESAAEAAAELDCAGGAWSRSRPCSRKGSGAELQRRVQVERGMDGLLAYLVEETARLD